MNIEGSIVLITGANRGIGKAYVEEFFKAGAKKIYLGVRDPSSVDDIIAAAPDRLIPLKLDVTNAQNVKTAADMASDTEILINNAGILFSNSLDTPDAIEQSRKEMDVNYFGVLAMTQAFAPVLKQNGGGLIITISSIAGHVTFPGLMTYSASKYAAQSLILSSRLALTNQRTRVIGVYPGPIETDMTSDFEFDAVPANVVPLATLEAIKNGEEDVFPDEFAKELYQKFRQDPKAVEKQMAEMAHQEEAA